MVVLIIIIEIFIKFKELGVINRRTRSIRKSRGMFINIVRKLMQYT